MILHQEHKLGRLKLGHIIRLFTYFALCYNRQPTICTVGHVTDSTRKLTQNQIEILGMSVSVNERYISSV